MCVIIEHKAGTKFPDKHLENAVLNNSDGWGLIVAQDKKLVVSRNFNPKEPTDPDQVKAALLKYHDYDKYLHLRFCTKGARSKGNVHPFKVFERKDHEIYLMHNGTMGDFGKDGIEDSDTKRFAEVFIRPLLERFEGNTQDPILIALLDKFLPALNRVLLVSNRNGPTFLGDWDTFKPVLATEGDEFKVSNLLYFQHHQTSRTFENPEKKAARLKREEEERKKRLNRHHPVVHGGRLHPYGEYNEYGFNGMYHGAMRGGIPNWGQEDQERQRRLAESRAKEAAEKELDKVFESGKDKKDKEFDGLAREATEKSNVILLGEAKKKLEETNKENQQRPFEDRSSGVPGMYPLGAGTSKKPDGQTHTGVTGLGSQHVPPAVSPARLTYLKNLGTQIRPRMTPNQLWGFLDVSDGLSDEDISLCQCLSEDELFDYIQSDPKGIVAVFRYFFNRIGDCALQAIDSESEILTLENKLERAQKHIADLVKKNKELETTVDKHEREIDELSDELSRRPNRKLKRIAEGLRKRRDKSGTSGDIKHPVG